MNPADLEALWNEARAAVDIEPGDRASVEALDLAESGHPSARAIVDREIAAFGDTPPVALTRLRIAMGQP